MRNRILIFISIGITVLHGNTFQVSNVTELRTALESAAANGEDDAILLKSKVYKTTADEGGTFVYNGAEAYKLSIEAADGVTNVALDGNGIDSVLEINSTEKSTVSLKNLIIVNGSKNGITSNSYLEIDKSRIYNNGGFSGYQSGGGILAKDGLKLSNSEVYDNKGYNGGGILINGLSSERSSSIINSTIRTNHSFGDHGGGGLFVYEQTTEIRESLIEENTAKGGGAGVLIYSSKPVMIDRTKISSNSILDSNDTIWKRKHGAGVCVDGPFLLANSIIEHNTNSDPDTESGSGVGIFADQLVHDENKTKYKSIMINNTIADNNASAMQYDMHIGEGMLINNIMLSTEATKGIVIVSDSGIYNSYFDPGKLFRSSEAAVAGRNNQAPSDGTIAFGSDYHLLPEDTIAKDNGLSPEDPAFKALFSEPDYNFLKSFFLRKDFMGNQRVANGTIDIGAIEQIPGSDTYSTDDTLAQRIQALYVAFYNRASDKGGLDYWYESISSGERSFEELSEGFATHPKFLEEYGSMNNEQFVIAIYINMLGNAPDAGGLSYWKRLLDGDMSKSDFIATFIKAAFDTDLDAMLANGDLTQQEYDDAVIRRDMLINKSEVAIQFVHYLGDGTNVTKLNDLDNDPAYQASIKILSGITQEESTKECTVGFLGKYASGNGVQGINNINNMNIFSDCEEE